jgi:hypothetical protein
MERDGPAKPSGASGRGAPGRRGPRTTAEKAALPAEYRYRPRLERRCGKPRALPRKRRGVRTAQHMWRRWRCWRGRWRWWRWRRSSSLATSARCAVLQQAASLARSACAQEPGRMHAPGPGPACTCLCSSSIGPPGPCSTAGTGLQARWLDQHPARGGRVEQRIAGGARARESGMRG